jgi:GNAT superfamily N-acetyltransferase
MVFLRRFLTRRHEETASRAFVLKIMRTNVATLPPTSAAATEISRFDAELTARYLEESQDMANGRRNWFSLNRWWDDAMDVRAAEQAEIDTLAKIWYDGWQDAHAEILPEELARVRTLESFRDRLHTALPDVRVAGAPGEPVGLCIVQGDELYQLYVSARSRGSGVAQALVADAEARLSENGVATAWLACAIGNQRAARFYEKCGWRRVGNMINQLDTPNGIFSLEVWRYEKPLKRPP